MYSVHVHMYNSAFPAVSLGLAIPGQIFVYETISKSNHRGSHILVSWMAPVTTCFITKHLESVHGCKLTDLSIDTPKPPVFILPN